MSETNMTEEDFRKKYEDFRESLPSIDSGIYAKLYTESRNSPFRVYKNSKGITIKPFTKNANSMTISLNQLIKVQFDNEGYNLVSYEPIILKRIMDNNTIKKEEIKNEVEIINDYPIPGKSTALSKNKIKNIILYGSPGVGKTHNTNKLISLLESRIPEKDIFKSIKENKKETIDLDEDLKSRTKFITFHQSFGYEDFIEGFRPNEEGKIELEDGVFKDMCKNASMNMTKSYDTSKLIFEDAFDILLKEKIENDELVKINLQRENSYYEIYDYNHKSISYTRQGRSRDIKYHTLSIMRLKLMYDTESYESITGGLKTYYKPLLEKLLLIGSKEKIEKVEQKNYYLVIDEINRGNISKIFGELITLIEEDKRDKLEVTLPYSKQPFKIPSNLYIIGTMNSTDKSIALIDIALRRRFTFLKMKPNAGLISNEKARDLFERLNEHIKNSHLGEDYQVGHSYFMGIDSDDDLEFVWEYKIVPLLEEYFYGDEDGLRSILKVR